MKINSSQGGCWYCCNTEGEMYFTWEFDAYFHLDCLKRQIQLNKENNWEDPETEIIESEFKEVLYG